jgi:ABC-type antimicrobial peptide transport system permease subunit
MFQRGYLISELRRRWGRTLVTALGLAVGVGLVIRIVGVSQGLEAAQESVLSPLQAIGTDILVTRVAGSTESTSATTGSATTGNGTTGPAQAGQAPTGTAPPGGGGFFGGPGGEGLNQADTQALLAENANVITDLSKLGNPGETFTHDFFLSSTLLSFPADALAAVNGVDGVASAVGGLTQSAQHQTGTVPQIVASIQTGGETVTQTVRPDPMTEAEQQAYQQCLTDAGVTIQAPQAQGTPDQPGQGPSRGGGGGRGGGAFQSCLPERLREFRATFTSPLRTIQQVVNPPATDITTTSYTAAGIDPAQPKAGLVTDAQLTGGRWIAASGDAAATEVLLNQAYANRLSLPVGSPIPLNGKTYTVVGLVKPTLTGSIADVYFPLATLQDLAGKQGRVTQILVKVDDADRVDAVAAGIKAALPGAEVITTKALADQVTGSLADAKKLTDRLGGVLGVIVLASAFVIAVLLTLASVGKRVREIGTLRAIGWSRRRVVSQILAETVGIGVIGAVLGIGIGYLASAAVSMFSPELTATAQGVAGFGGSSLSRLFGQATEVATSSATVRLTAPVHLSTLAAGMGLAVVGGLLAGGIGALRASRLAPAEALRNLA